MLAKIISYSVRNPLIVLIGAALLIGSGWYSMTKIPLDAVPDITSNQVQIVTQSPSLSAEEVEQFITYPLELTVQNLPGVEEVRSISKFGLSILTVVFEEDVEDLQARQLVSEQLDIAKQEIPTSLGVPEMMPITTGLGEIYQYVVRVSPSATQYSATELRTIQDWIIKRQLGGIPGIIEISSFGGFVKQYEVIPIPSALSRYGVSLEELGRMIQESNHSAGGSYYSANNQSFFVRADGRLSDIAELKSMPLRLVHHQNPVLLSDLARVQTGNAVRFGAMTMDGLGEVVGGITLMLKGENAHATVAEVRQRVAQVQKSLPEGVYIEPYLDRSALVDRTTSTVAKNLIEGGLIVILVLVLLLGNLRAGLIVASVIPLAMLFAITLMNYFGVSANLMSLGAIDFGIVVDGAVIVTEHILAVLSLQHLGKRLSRDQFQNVIAQSSVEMIKSAVFGVLIILVVFLPIVSLVGIEGKMFRPMAQTVSFALIGALLLSITYVPAMMALFMKKEGTEEPKYSRYLVGMLVRRFEPTLRWSLKNTRLVLGLTAVLFLVSVWKFTTMGSEFIPKLDEGDLAVQLQLPTGTSLEESIATSSKTEKILLESFPQIKHVVSKIGTAEVPTDPMSIEQADIMIIMQPDLHLGGEEKLALIEQMSQTLADQIPYASFEFTQPIELRFNELISGAKSDIAVKLFGADFQVLSSFADQMVPIIDQVEGAVDVKREQTDGLNQRQIVYDRSAMANLGVSVASANRVVESAFAGMPVSTLYEGDRKFDIVIRFDGSFRKQPDLNSLFVSNVQGELVAMGAFAKLVYQQGPSLISRENGQRRIVVGANVRGRDIASVVADIQSGLDALDLPAGYFIQYGGDFQQLQHAQARLAIAVPVSLLAIFILLVITFGDVRLASIVFITVPMSTIGGVAALALRGMPFSISAGIGFIALFGVAVLNGIVMVNILRKYNGEGPKRMIELAVQRLRPVVITAAVAALGFVPMAISTGAGAEVQKPLATVVIGGLVTAALLTLVVLPVVYYRFGQFSSKVAKSLVVGLLLLPAFSNAQSIETKTLDQALQVLQEHGLGEQRAELALEKVRALNKTQWNAPVQASMQRGEINGDFQSDYWLQFEWMLPSLTAMPSLRALQRAKLAQAEQQGTYIKSVEEYRLRQQWHRLQMHESILTQFELKYQEAQALSELVRARAEQGILPQRDVLQWSVWTEELHHELKKWHKATDESRALVNVLLGWEAGQNWKSDVPVALVPASPLVDPTASLLLLQQHATLKVERSALSLQKNSWLPEVGVGAFSQRLEGVGGFTGISLSTTIPIAPNVYTGGVQRRKLELQEAEVNFEQALREWKNHVQVMQRDLERWNHESHHTDLGEKPKYWEVYSAGGLDLQGLWQTMSAYYDYNILMEEHFFERQRLVEEWNFYHKTK